MFFNRNTQKNEEKHKPSPCTSLSRSLNKLNIQYRKEKQGGLSKEFYHQAKAMEISIEICDKAMKNLSTQYMERFSAFKESKDPIQSLESLNEAEKIWKKEARVIEKLDPSEKESAFLKRMREQALTVLENKLIEASENNLTHSAHKNAALCLGILGIMDRILDELGYPKNAKTRDRLSRIAKSFIAPARKG